jgi:molybdopterin-synthase adenylyltransferase
MDESRYSRNSAFFGADGQARIAATRVAIVGLGGLGAHIAQQLAYLGILDYGLIDRDVATESSLNRLVGATQRDVDERAPKTLVAERTIKAIQPEATVRPVLCFVPEDRAEQVVRESDVVFACVDDDAARLDIIKICAAAGIAFFDLASDIDPGSEHGPTYGGRVLFSGAGERCPHCMELLDMRVLQLAGMSADERTAHKGIYGVERSQLDQAGPAVVSINAVIASLAVTEFLVWRSGLREAAPVLTYRGDLGVVRRSEDTPIPGCPYCSSWPR